MILAIGAVLVMLGGVMLLSGVLATVYVMSHREDR